MKITKAEKSLWTFLNIFKSIISKTGGQTVAVGNRGTLVISALNHYGVFKYRSDGMIDSYDFGTDTFYELKQLPSGDYVLDRKDSPITSNQQEQMLHSVITLLKDGKWVIELDKGDRHKIAKITASTGLWMEDGDIRYLNAFPQIDVLAEHETKSLILKSYGLSDEDISTVEMYLMFTGLECRTAVQQKITEVEDIEKTADELIDETEAELGDEFEDEFEDDFDPMLA